ncbi:MAG: 3-dehydroquinate synthase, partial [Bacteroidia bacterium]|nr:3-dehydroquinate synthase [Bacteroidia bacterium]
TFEQFTENLQYSNNCIILSEKTIYTLYPQLFQTNSPRLILDINEKNKSLATAESIWNFFVQNKITKTHTVFIIGGGVLHDVALFACSVFKRGLQVISVPTTLLSMVDASIGGKNAINYQCIKNLIGTIYLPSQNIIIPDFLKTLSQQELLSGWAEIIKIAMVIDKDFYATVTQQMNNSLTPTFSLIEKSIQLKLHIIQQDLNDEGIRQLLNFGHTIAHAIEAIYDEENKYIPHG